MTISQNAPGVVNGGQVTVVWDDFGSLATATPTPLDRIVVDAIQAPTGASPTLSPGPNVQVTVTTVRGGQDNTSVTTSAAAPLGIGPAPTLASDNTLGAFSQFQGRLYLAYVDRYDPNAGFTNNPADNTDIFLLVSNNGGASWSSLGSGKVNDDRAVTDGFSESNNSFQAGDFAGRAQFEPSVAVDQATGTLVVSYYDGRYDGSRSRVATTIAASIDGGSTFGPQTFANTALKPLDQATGSTVNLGPIPDNESAGNTAMNNDRTLFAFGIHQGLAVSNGHVYPVWSSNLNGGNDGQALLDIRVAQATITAGPRIISGTMGPVGLTGDTLNNNTAADGTPIAKAFVVTFDRPVDPSTFTASQVQVFFHDTVAGSTPVAVPIVGQPVALNAGTFGATQFQVNFTPSSGVGTYSYSVGPNIQDRIRSTTSVFNPAGGFSSFVSTDVPKLIPDFMTIQSSLTVSGFPAATPLFSTRVHLTLTHTFDADLIITLIAPDGTRVVLSNRRGGAGQNFTNTVFDDAAATPISQGFAPFTGSFKPDGSLLQLRGLTPMNGVWKLEVADVDPQDSGNLVSWSLDLQPGTVTTTSSTGNLMDENGDGLTGQSNDFFAAPTPTGNTAFTAPYKQDTLPLIVPGPHVISIAAQNQQAGAADHLVLNNTTSYVDVTFDRDMNASTFGAGQVLRMQGPAGLVSGPFTVTATSARTFRVGFPTQQLSGTYTLTLGSAITSASGSQIDANLNAGVDVLRGTSTNAPAAVTFNSSAVPVVLTPQKTVSSQITLSDDFVNQGLTLNLNITYPNDPDLSAVLIAPDGTRINLFTNVGGSTPPNFANFSNTVFDDTAATAIGNGGPPFFGRFRPEQALGALTGSSSVRGPGGTGVGVYTLEITNNSTTRTGTLTSWSITLKKPVPNTGLGEPVADRSQASFRIFTMEPTNPLASTTWTSVGPASVGQVNSGRIGGLAVDPSDPSGNTVYVAGASGGVWKTNNFLTTSPQGPTYIPITDFGATFGVNIGGIAVFGRNNDPNQSIVYVATGEGDTGSRGVGILRSMDGGATWTLLDSTNNTLAYANRDHRFVGSTSFKIVVDPRPTVTGDVIVYAALSGNNGGIWRSLDSGQTWGVIDTTTGQRVANRAGQATDVVLDPNSGPVDAVSNPTGNLQVVYGAFRGDGVYISPNEGQIWNILAGGVGDPLIQDRKFNPPRPIAVNNLGTNPNGANGRIVLAKPDLFPASDANATLKNFIYQGFLYAAVATPDDHLQGLYVTKDNGQNWTKIRIPTIGTTGVNNVVQAIPSNNAGLGDYDPLGNASFAQGNYDVSLTIDPTNPEVVYLGGTRDGQPSGLLRIDVSGLADPHAFFLDGNRSDNNALTVNLTSGVALDQNPLVTTPSGTDPRSTPYTNLIRDPASPLSGNATFYVRNTASFSNNGTGAKWIPFDSALAGSTDQHRVVAIRDPLTGHARLIFGDDQGVFSGVDNGDGTLSAGIGTASSPTGTRNGNLQITQFYYGAAQPSSAAAQIAGALFYGQAQDDGFPRSDRNVLTNGNISWSGPAGDGTGVATDQTGVGTLYQYNWPCCGGNVTDFFQVNGVGATNGLIQASGGRLVPDPQWPFLGGFNFAVNPINGKQIVISSGAGRIFRTEDQGKNWLVIGAPATFGGSNAPALAFGAPDPNAPGGVGSLDNFIYAGTTAGQIYVTFTGGSSTGNAWININNGALAGNGSAVQAIVTNPIRGSHEAYAVTTGGVYYISDSNPASGATWQNITGNLFQINHNIFGLAGFTETQLKYLTSLMADWRYVIPDNLANPTGPNHPMLYAAGEGGVYRSFDKGQTWSLFPSAEPGSLATTPTPPGAGGGIPNAHVTDLDLSIGNVDPTTGRSIAAAGDPNILLATTFGRGSFAIRLAPVVFANSLALDPNLPIPIGSVGGTDSSGRPIVTITQPVFDGLSEQTAFGNRVRITILDVTDPANPKVIGGFNPADATTDIAANYTDNFGRFAVQVSPNGFTSSGIKTIGLQATDASGTKGNIATLVINLQAPLSIPTTPTLTMDPADDTSGGQFITAVTSPHLIGKTDPGIQVQLFNSVGGVPSGAALGTQTTLADGSFRFQYPNSPPGTYTVQVVATNTKGSSTSAPFSFTINTSGPTLVPTLFLNPADDTGIKGDGITSNRLPHFIGVTIPGGKVTLYQSIGGNLVAQGTPVTADASGNYSIQLPHALSDGTITLVAGYVNSSGLAGPNSAPLTVTIVSVLGDYTGVGKTTPAVFRRSATGTGLWFIQGVSPVGGIPFGSATLDIPFTGDFDGDGINDLAFYRPSTNTWDIKRSSFGETTYVQGSAGTVPVTGNFDGSGLTETGVFRPTTGQWTLLENSGTVLVNFPATPLAGDVPVPGDYEGIGKDDLAVYRPSTGQFLIQESSGLVTINLATGGSGDVPVPGNYDNSLTYHKTEIAVYNPTSGVWLIKGPSANRSVQFNPGDIPAPGDYDGTGVTETAVYRPSAASFIISGPSGTIPFGASGDIPVTSPLVYRNITASTGAPTLALAATSDTGIVGDGITSNRRPFFSGKTTAGATVDLVNSSGAVLNSTTADSGGNFTVQYSPTVDLANGTYTVLAKNHATGALSAPVTVKLITVDGDSNGDGTTDPALFRRVSSSLAQWFVQNNTALLGRSFGSGTLDVPLAGDFNGDGKVDLGLYRPSTGQWFVQLSGATNYAGQLLATTTTNTIPVPANYSGNGTTLVGNFLPTTGQWIVAGQTTAVIATPKTGDVPVPANYDNTGKDEFAIFRPGSPAQWIISGPNGAHTISFGGPNDVPVPGAYDATVSSQTAEAATFRPSTGQWFILGPTGGRILQFAVGDIPAPGDYDGIGRTEAAVYRPSVQKWFVQGPNDAAPRLFTNFGGSKDIPTLSPYVYRAPGGGKVSGGTISAAVRVAAVDFGATAQAFTAGATAAVTSAPAAATAPAGTTTNRIRPTQLFAKPVNISSHPLLQRAGGVKKTKILSS